MKPALLFSCIVMAASAVTHAQAPPSATTPQARTAPRSPDHAVGCTPNQSTRQGDVVPKGTTTGQSREPLGDQLSKSDGVLCPPAGVDPQMRAPTPETGNTPVIPPPGSPGGDPNVRPK
jgi:hypothetical protein